MAEAAGLPKALCPTGPPYSLLGQGPSGKALEAYLSSLGGQPKQEPEMKTFPDMTYHIHHALGLSLGFAPTAKGSTSLGLDQLDFYNPPPPAPTTAARPSLSYSKCPATLLPPPLTPDMTVVELLSHLGEPTRKGGGAGNLGKISPGIFLEWTNLELSTSETGSEGVRKLGLLVEFDERGQGCWAKDRLEVAVWRSASIFRL